MLQYVKIARLAGADDERDRELMDQGCEMEGVEDGVVVLQGVSKTVGCLLFSRGVLIHSLKEKYALKTT